MKVLIDIDDTITNFCVVLLKKLNEIYHTNYTKKDITHWNWLRETFPNPWLPLEQKEFWDEIVVDENSINFIENLVKSGMEVYLVTAAFPSDALGYKLRKTLSFFNENLINYRNIIVCYDKHIIKGDIRIDDAIHNLTDRNSTNFLMSQPWNENVNAEKYCNFIRINSIKDLEFLL